MSMIAYLITLSSEQTHTLEKDADTFIDSFLDEVESGSGSDLFDIAQTWHVIHFLLTGDPDEGEVPQRNVLFVDREVGSDMGYGPARLLNVDEVLEVDRLLRSLPDDFVASNWDPAAFDKNEIFPGPWADGEDDEQQSYVQEYFDQMCAFYERAAAEKLSVLQFLS